MIKLSFINFEESGFITGYIKMKTPIIMNWYPRLKSLEIALSKEDDDLYMVSGVMNFSDAVTELSASGHTAVQAIDAFLKEIDPEENTLPPLSKAVMQQSV